MKKTTVVAALLLGSAISAFAAQQATPRQRVSAPRDHTPTVHSNAPQPHK